MPLEKHSYSNWNIQVDANCYNTGIFGRYTCSGCNNYFDDKYNKLNDVTIGITHSFVNSVCSICDSINYCHHLTFELDEDCKSYTVVGRGNCTNPHLYIPTEHNGITVGKIGYMAFAGCSTLESVVVPNSVTIGYYAFDDCENLKTMSFAIGELPRSSDSACYFDQIIGQGYLITKPETVIITNTDSVPRRAFYASEALSNVILADGITKIDSQAFYGSSLTSITISSTVVEIGDSAFGNCKNLSSVHLPDSVNKLGSSVFNMCSKLTDVVGVQI